MNSLTLFPYSESVAKHLLFMVSLGLPVCHSSIGADKARLRKYHTIQHCIIPVVNAAARLVFCTSRHDHTTPLHLQWLHAPKQISYKLAMLVCRRVQGLCAAYLADA